MDVESSEQGAVSFEREMSAAVGQEWRDIKADLADLGRLASSIGGERFDRASRGLRSELSGIGRAASRYARDAARVTDARVRREPYKAVATGFVLGVLLGVLIPVR